MKQNLKNVNPISKFKTLREIGNKMSEIMDKMLNSIKKEPKNDEEYNKNKKEYAKLKDEYNKLNSELTEPIIPKNPNRQNNYEIYKK